MNHFQLNVVCIGQRQVMQETLNIEPSGAVALVLRASAGLSVKGARGSTTSRRLSWISLSHHASSPAGPATADRVMGKRGRATSGMGGSARSKTRTSYWYAAACEAGAAKGDLLH